MKSVKIPKHGMYYIGVDRQLPLLQLKDVLCRKIFLL